MKNTVTVDPEIAAISIVHNALSGLQPDAQARVLAYVSGKLALPAVNHAGTEDGKDSSPSIVDKAPPTPSHSESEPSEACDLNGISPIARKWMTRNAISVSQLDPVFSLGADEIDLVATEIPGKNKKERLHSVFLLKGIAAYLATGAPRLSHEQMKAAALHYDAYDAANFAAYFRSMTGEISGEKSTGYTLNPRGITSATAMFKSMVGAKKGS